MYTFERNIEKYAEIAVNVGVNLKAGENLVIRGDLDGLPLMREIAKAAYKAGANHVQFLPTDGEMVLSRYTYGRREAFEYFPNWLSEAYKGMIQENYSMIYVSSADPELLKDIDPKIVALDAKTTSNGLLAYSEATMTGRMKWNVIGMPSKAWAKMVFPEQSDEEAIELLWDKIFEVSRIYAEDPVMAWKQHDDRLKKYCQFLNDNQFEKFLYKGPGTDLEVYLAEGHEWIGGSKPDVNGVSFLPNVPTEEVFTMPHAKKINGTLKSTKPLTVRGQLIDGFGFEFKDGKVIDYYAEKGKEVLKSLLETDEGALYLGEIALVPVDSPISNSGIIFSNTLYDENASCHFALGKAYPYTIVGGSDMSKEALAERGANFSLIHVDFMVGSSELDIIGVTKDGKEIDIFKAGNWAFEV